SICSISSGIPCALVRYCVIPPITICMMCFLPSMVGWLLDHWSNAVSIFSMTLVHCSLGSVLFPTQAPRILVGSPSPAMCMSLGIVSYVSRVLLVCITFCLYSSEPIEMTSVFVMLNFAPEAVHHFFRVLWRFENLSFA